MIYNLAENIVVIRGPRTCGDEPIETRRYYEMYGWTPRMRG